MLLLLLPTLFVLDDPPLKCNTEHHSHYVQLQFVSLPMSYTAKFHMSADLSVCLSVCLSVSPSVCLSDAGLPDPFTCSLHLAPEYEKAAAGDGYFSLHD